MESFKKSIRLSSILILLTISVFPGKAQSEKLNIVVLGAHPDDADYKMGGTAILYAESGHNVLFVSMTNGNAGHYKLKGKKLAKIRKKEAFEAGKRMDITYLVLDNPDGKLMPTLENRNELIKIIRKWNADIVIGHRPNDYHPDHRNASVLMQDAAFMVIVPNIVPGVPPLKKNPVFLYMEDTFQKPQPFRPDICIDISGSYTKKIYAMAAHESQYFEWLPWTIRSLEQVPESEEDRLNWLSEKRKPIITEEEKNCLIKWYGKEQGTKITLAESFEICEYGRHPSLEEIIQLFPMLNNRNNIK